MQVEYSQLLAGVFFWSRAPVKPPGYAEAEATVSRYWWLYPFKSTAGENGEVGRKAEANERNEPPI